MRNYANIIPPPHSVHLFQCIRIAAQGGLDGTDRAMICTLNEDFGAKYSTNETVVEGAERKTKKSNPDVCPVWDCEANAWRSFRWDRLKQIDYKIG